MYFIVTVPKTLATCNLENTWHWHTVQQAGNGYSITLTGFNVWL